MKKLSFVLLSTLGLLCASLTSHAAVQGKEVVYKSGKVSMKGYLAWDDAIKGKRPGMLVVHEWWGHNEYARKRARMLAEQGYTALAVDMYGDGKQAQHPKDAGAFMDAVLSSADHGRARFEAAMKVLKADKTVDKNRIGAIGYCFGGAVVLNMARAGENLKGVAAFHPGLGGVSEEQPGKIKAAVRVFTGSADAMVTPEQISALKNEMAKAHVDFKLVEYPGVKHSFTNPEADALGKKFDLPLAYDAAADKDSWEQSMAMFKQVFAAK